VEKSAPTRAGEDGFRTRRRLRAYFKLRGRAMDNYLYALARRSGGGGDRGGVVNRSKSLVAVAIRAGPGSGRTALSRNPVATRPSPAAQVAVILRAIHLVGAHAQQVLVERAQPVLVAARPGYGFVAVGEPTRPARRVITAAIDESTVPCAPDWIAQENGLIKHAGDLLPGRCGQRGIHRGLEAGATWR